MGGGGHESFGLPGMIGGGSGLRSRRVGSASAANRDRTQSMSASRQAAPSRGGVSFGSAPRLSSTSTAPAPPRRRPRRAATSRCRCAGSTPRRGRSGAVPPSAGWRGRRWPTSDRRRSPAEKAVHHAKPSLQRSRTPRIEGEPGELLAAGIEGNERAEDRLMGQWEGDEARGGERRWHRLHFDDSAAQ